MSQLPVCSECGFADDGGGTLRPSFNQTTDCDSLGHWSSEDEDGNCGGIKVRPTIPTLTGWGEMEFDTSDGGETVARILPSLYARSNQIDKVATSSPSIFDFSPAGIHLKCAGVYHIQIWCNLDVVQGQQAGVEADISESLALQTEPATVVRTSDDSWRDVSVDGIMVVPDPTTIVPALRTLPTNSNSSGAVVEVAFAVTYLGSLECDHLAEPAGEDVCTGCGLDTSTGSLRMASGTATTEHPDCLHCDNGMALQRVTPAMLLRLTDDDTSVSSTSNDNTLVQVDTTTGQLSQTDGTVTVNQTGIYQVTCRFWTRWNGATGTRHNVQITVNGSPVSQDSGDYSTAIPAGVVLIDRFVETTNATLLLNAADTVRVAGAVDLDAAGNDMASAIEFSLVYLGAVAP